MRNIDLLKPLRFPLALILFLLVDTSPASLSTAFGQNETATDKADTSTEVASEEGIEIAAKPSYADDPQLAFLFNAEEPKSLSQLHAMEAVIREVSNRVYKATVNIQVGDSQGTGVIVSDDGYVLTAAHVISQPNQRAFVVLADGRRLRAKTLGLNSRVDSGMLKIEVPEGESGLLPWIDLGESGTLQPGSWVIAIGHPGGLDPKRGMVTRAGRMISSSPTVMQTDCSLVGGDSGGPLVDMNGYLVGIHSRIGGRLWDNLHVPVDAFLDEWDQLENGKNIGRKPQPHIGMNLVDNTNVVESVVEGDPADEAGIKAGDRIIRFNGQEVSSRSELAVAIRGVKIGDQVEIVINRAEGETESELTVKLKIGER